MAIAHVGNAGLLANSTASSTSTFNTTEAFAAGDFGILAIACDERAPDLEGDDTPTVSVSGGNGTWSFLGYRANNPSGTDKDGTCVALYLFECTGTTASGTTITVTYFHTPTDDSGTFHKFTKAAGMSVREVAGSEASNIGSGSGVGSLSTPVLASASRLYVRAFAKEVNSTTAVTPTTNFTAMTVNRSRNNNAAQTVAGEFRINTSTSETSNPTWAVNGDYATLFLALEEYSSTPTLTQRAFRFYEDGTESGAVAISAENTNITRDPATEALLQLRIGIQHTGGNAISSRTFRLERSLNGGAWNAVDNSDAVVRIVDGALTNGSATTQRLSSGTGSFDSGQQIDSSVSGIYTENIPAARFTENVFEIQLQSGGLAAGDTVDFRITDQTAPPTSVFTYSQVPRITIASSGTPVGLATSVATAFALGSARPAGLATSVATALALGVSRPVGLATTTETAIARTQAFPPGVALETNTAFARGVARPVGLATEAGTALALAGVQKRAVGLAISTATAFALGAARPAGLATSVATALALGSARPAGIATSVSTALTLGVARPAGLALTTETAFARTAIGGGSVGLATETDVAFARGVARPVGLATETETSLALAGIQRRAVGLALTAETALILSVARPVGLSSESSLAFARAGIQARAAGLATASDLAFALTPVQKMQVGLAISGNIALSLTGLQLRPVGLAIANDNAIARPAVQLMVVGLASEINEALNPAPPGPPAVTPDERKLAITGGGTRQATLGGVEQRHAVVSGNQTRTTSVGGGGDRGVSIGGGGVRGI